MRYLVIRENVTEFETARVAKTLTENNMFEKHEDMADQHDDPQDVTEYEMNLNIDEFNKILLPFNFKMEVIDEKEWEKADSMDGVIPRTGYTQLYKLALAE